ncbi:hypothetical protein [Mesorhizobium loti]|uniref:RNA polymerase sigma-70 region 4 domain-containing protein n=1 Tax=Mesorhizobium loti R88b TaxID=935548 RepID=A0A6M7WTX6_RHILI|nr:hypothetical protein [Mesorhizobium loti]QKD03348.1 hypothetical protein EB235_19060 [Mesorhizobium loti R88b]
MAWAVRSGKEGCIARRLRPSLHDLRGTDTTKFYINGLTEHEIAEIMSLGGDIVSRIIRHCIDRATAINDRIKRLNEARTRM